MKIDILSGTIRKNPANRKNPAKTEPLQKTRKSRFGIKIKLISAFLATIIPIILLGCISYTQSASSIKTLTTSSASQAMQQANKYLELLFWNIEATSVQLSENGITREFICAPRETPAEKLAAFEKNMEDLISKTIYGSSLISDIAVVGPFGRASSSPGYDLKGIGLDAFKDSEMYKNASVLDGGIVWLGGHPELDGYETAKNEGYALYAAKILKYPEADEAAGLLIINIKPAVIDSLIKGIALGKTGEVHLVSPDGRDIYSLRGEESGASSGTPFIEEQFYKGIKNSIELSGSKNVRYKNRDNLLFFSRLGSTRYLLVD